MYSVFYSDGFGNVFTAENYLSSSPEAIEVCKRLRAKWQSVPYPLMHTHAREFWIERVGSTKRILPKV